MDTLLHGAGSLWLLVRAGGEERHQAGKAGQGRAGKMGQSGAAPAAPTAADWPE